MLPDIEQGLAMWRTLNATPMTWARFEALHFEHERAVRVTWGRRRLDGTKEQAIQTIRFSLHTDGTVDVTRHTHA